MKPIYIPFPKLKIIFKDVTFEVIYQDRVFLVWFVYIKPDKDLVGGMRITVSNENPTSDERFIVKFKIEGEYINPTKKLAGEYVLHALNKNRNPES